MPKKKTENLIKVSTILEAAHDNLSSRNQWLEMADLGRALRYDQMAESLIELLEVYHCGSVGGFGVYKGKNQEKEPGYYEDLPGRLKWLDMVYAKD